MMNTNDEIGKQKQTIARCEKSLALEKIKQRKADTRQKIELGGLVIKAGMSKFNKKVILGALLHSIELIKKDENYLSTFEFTGRDLF